MLSVILLLPKSEQGKNVYLYIFCLVGLRITSERCGGIENDQQFQKILFRICGNVVIVKVPIYVKLTIITKWEREGAFNQ